MATAMAAMLLLASSVAGTSSEPCAAGSCDLSDQTSLLSRGEKEYTQQGQQRPNFLFILVDDLGFGDVDICPNTLPYEQCPLRPTDPGRKHVLKTPRLKRMASEGMVMTNFYAPRAICSPSRMASLVGRDPVRFAGVDQHLRIFANTGARGGLPTTEETTAKRLKKLGYDTGYSGKWHMGLTNGTDPFAYAAWNHGFDSVEFFLEGSNGEPCHGGMLNPPDNPEVMHMCSFSHVLNSRGEVLEQPIRWENMTARQLNVTLSFIRSKAGGAKPWFFQHAFTAVHVPWNPSRFFVSDPTQRFWTDMVSEMDWAVGVLLDELVATKQENTMVLLSSDNGPYLEFASSHCPTNCRIQLPEFQREDESGTLGAYGCTPCNAATVSLPGPLSGGKGQVWEGGVRVPGIFWWPGKIKGGTVNPLVASQMDLLPTMVALAGGQVDDIGSLDGRDISESLLSHPDPSGKPEGTFAYWCGTTLFAVRVGEHKVYYQTQLWVNGEAKATAPMYCGGTGKCCLGSPSRLCTCGGLGWENYVQAHSPPKAVNLTANPGEDLALVLEGEEYAQAVQRGNAFRLQRLQSVAEGLGLKVTDDPEALQRQISRVPNMMQVDVQVPDPTNSSRMLPPLEYQMKEFRPYDHCSPGLPDDKCKSRFICAVDPDYPGPYEYVLPDGSKCGTFRQPSGTSAFPEDLLPSVRRWHEDAGLVPVCLAGNASSKNMKACHMLEKYGLNNIPTGKIWNAGWTPRLSEWNV